MNDDTREYVLGRVAELIANRLADADLFFDADPSADETDPHKAAINIIAKTLDEVLIIKR